LEGDLGGGLYSLSSREVIAKSKNYDYNKFYFKYNQTPLNQN